MYAKNLGFLFDHQLNLDAQINASESKHQNEQLFDFKKHETTKRPHDTHCHVPRFSGHQEADLTVCTHPIDGQ
jgi:hypothetical protein